jgi:hypothetical protein
MISTRHSFFCGNPTLIATPFPAIGKPVGSKRIFPVFPLKVK